MAVGAGQYRLKKDKQSDVEIAIEKCELSGNTLTCYITYKYSGASPNATVSFRTSSCKLIRRKGQYLYF